MTYRTMLKEGLQQQTRIDTLVGSPPRPAGLPGGESPAAPRPFWAAILAQQPRAAGRRRLRDGDSDDTGRRAA